MMAGMCDKGKFAKKVGMEMFDTDSGHKEGMVRDYKSFLTKKHEKCASRKSVNNGKNHQKK